MYVVRRRNVCSRANANEFLWFEEVLVIWFNLSLA